MQRRPFRLAICLALTAPSLAVAQAALDPSPADVGSEAAAFAVDACAALADDSPRADADADAFVRYADRLAGCDHVELAESLYREILSGRPGPDVRLRALAGLAAALAAQGRDEAAERIYAELIGGPVAVLSRPAGARADAEAGADAGSQPASRRFAQRARLRLDAGGPVRPSQSTRIDGPGIKTVAQGESRLLAGAGSVVSARLEEVGYELVDRSMGLQITRPGLWMQQRLGQGVEWHGKLAADHMAWRGVADSSTRWTYDTGIGVQQGDLLRVQLASSRTSLDNLAALQRGAVANATRAGLDLTPDSASRYALRYERGAQSDGNLRTSLRAETEHRLDVAPNVWLGGRMTHAESARLSADGYASLSSVASTMLTVRFDDAVSRRIGRLGYGVSLGLGNGLVSADADRPLYDLSLRGSWRMASGTLLEARLQSLGLNASQAGAPVRRTSAGINFNLIW